MFLLPFLALAIQAHAADLPAGLSFGPAYFMGSTSSYLTGYSTTLRVPKYPADSKGLIVIWPGINTDASPTNLVQTCIGAAEARTAGCPDTASGDQWCAFTSTNIAIDRQEYGVGVPVVAGKDLVIVYKYDEKTKQFGQTLSIDGKIVSTQSLAIGKGNQFNTAVEVQGGWAGTILAHTYTNNTFTFAAADTGFPENVIIEKGITASKPVSADGGKTWTVAQITIPDSKYGSSGFIAA